MNPIDPNRPNPNIPYVIGGPMPVNARATNQAVLWYPTGPDVQPSMNRGPGIPTAEETKSLRQKVSQNENAKEKKKISYNTAVGIAKSLKEIGRLIGGDGYCMGGYLRGRNHMSKKGEVIPASKGMAVNKTFSRHHASIMENVTLQYFPKYHPMNDEGTNQSPPIPLMHAAKMGFQCGLRGPIDNARGLRLADHGVNMFAMFRAELQNNDPHGPPPTDSEVKAAIQLALLMAPENSTKAPANRDGVNNI